MERNLSYIKERILQVADYKKVSKEIFFEKIGMTYGSFKGKMKESSVNSNAIESLLTIFPDISVEWLVMGKGNMIKNYTIENIVQEERDSYGLSELELKIKEQERIIEDLRSLVSYQKDHIQTLEKKSAVNTAIKNSA